MVPELMGRLHLIQFLIGKRHWEASARVVEGIVKRRIECVTTKKNGSKEGSERGCIDVKLWHGWCHGEQLGRWIRREIDRTYELHP